jgi:hypothetical protein
LKALGTDAEVFQTGSEVQGAIQRFFEQVRMFSGQARICFLARFGSFLPDSVVFWTGSKVWLKVSEVCETVSNVF